MADFKDPKITVQFTGNDYDEKKKLFIKEKVSIHFFEFEKLELKMYDKPDTTKNGGVKIGELNVVGFNNCTIRENEWDYGSYRSGTIDKDNLYFSVKKWLARKWQPVPINVTFREAIQEWHDAIDGDGDDTEF